SHADLIEQSGQLTIPSPGGLPEPSMEGKRILSKLPRGIWNPAICRMIEEAMSRQDEDEDNGADITCRMRSRVNHWFRDITPEVREVLVEMLKSEGDTASRPPSVAVGLKASEVAPEADTDIDEDFSLDA
ncbi:unnamed protein product, partial [Laminaria digitata]